MQRRRWPEEVYQAELEALTRNPRALDTDVHAYVVKLFGKSAPPLRTLRRHLKDLRGDDQSGPWNIAEADVDEVRPVLDFLRDSSDGGSGWGFPVTKKQGRWMHKLSKAAPGLSSGALHDLAREYIRRTDAAVPTSDLDAWIAFAPWLSHDNLLRYEDALTDGWINESVHAKGIVTRGAKTFQETQMFLERIARGEITFGKGEENEQPAR